jgi:hypothetical protein
MTPTQRAKATARAERLAADLTATLDLLITDARERSNFGLNSAAQTEWAMLASIATKAQHVGHDLRDLAKDGA